VRKTDKADGATNERAALPHERTQVRAQHLHVAAIVQQRPQPSLQHGQDDIQLVELLFRGVRVISGSAQGLVDRPWAAFLQALDHLVEGAPIGSKQAMHQHDKQLLGRKLGRLVPGSSSSRGS
jgi:hypothetical protein